MLKHFDPTRRFRELDFSGKVVISLVILSYLGGIWMGIITAMIYLGR